MKERLVALDIWRSALLLFGLLVHAAVLIRTLPGDTSGYSWIEEASRSARMQGFFVIAGYLAARSIGKRGPVDWLRTRTVQLLVPATVTWLTFARLTDWVATGDPFANIILIGHVWFLYTLAAFSLLTALFEGSGMRRIVPVLARRVDHAPLWLTVFALFVTALAAKVAVAAIFMTSPAVAQAQGAWANLHRLAATPVMGVFYAFGYLLAHCELAQRLPLRPMLALFVASAAAYIWMQQPDGYDVVAIPGLDHRLAMLVMYAMFTGSGVFLALTIFAHARTARSAPPLLLFLSRCSYTIYLVHLFYLTALFALLSPMINGRLALFCVLVLGSLSLSILTHFAIMRSRVLSLLFNGKSPRPPQSQPATAIVAS